ncbi:MAG: response regulator [Elusimicrobia bacterium]|nr:response regulator [Elusimicrobiota bacterium]
MSSDNKHRILLADDEPDLLIVIKQSLEMAGFHVETVDNGRQALDSIRARAPDIAILDLRMPGMDGFEVCRELRKDSLYEHLPLILLSAAGTRDTKIKGLNLGADDFITKPVDLQELLARIHMILKRTQQGLDANPLTRLPGNVSIQRRIKEAIESGKPLAVLYLDLNQFKAYNDAYGFEAGDKVIKATADILVKLTRGGKGVVEDFVGHIGGDDFIVLTHPKRMEALSRDIITDFDGMAPIFYNAKDRKNKKIVSTDRQGRVVEFPLLSIAIGICHNGLRSLTSYAQISHYGAELKKFAKQQPGSAYVVDRRR